MVSVLSISTAFGQNDLDQLEQRAFQAAVQRVAPAVLRVETIGGLDRVGRVAFGTGPTTGLVVDADGYVLSSAFAFVNEPSAIFVNLADGTRKPAQLVATDHSRMVVLLKIEVNEPLEVPQYVPRDEMQVGQWTIAVGRTFEPDRPNISVGILSAVNRVWSKAIQTDAAVSPNNYGGPLVDLYGRVLGLLVPMSPEAATEMAGIEWYDSGIGFAVPGFDLEAIVTQLKRGEDLHPGAIGISFSKGNLSTTKPVLATVHRNSPAYKAGLRADDRIVEVSERRVQWASQVKEELSRRYAGDSIRLVVRRGRQRSEHEVELVAKLEPYARPFLGILPMRPVPPEAANARPAGVTLRYVYPDGPAAKANIEPGDVLTTLAGEPIVDAAGLRTRIAELVPGDGVEIELRRRTKRLKRTVTLGTEPESLPDSPLPPATKRKPSSADPKDEVGLVEMKIPEFANEAFVYVPERYDPTVPHGLVVWLHAPGDFDEAEIVQRWKPHCDRDGLILLAPKASDSDGWKPQELTLIQKLIRRVDTNYHVDGSRVVVHGYKEGGSMAYLVAFQNRELVRAVASVDGPVASRPPENEPLYPLAIYTAWADESKASGRTEAAVSTMREMKYPVSVVNLGEKPRYLGPEELADLVRWIDTLDRI